MAIEHSVIPDGKRHEPKGISTATTAQVYAANGAGSGTWTDLAYDVTAVIPDVSTASFVIIPLTNNVVVTSIKYVLGAAITLANSTMTVTRGAAAAAMGTQVIAFTGSAEGTTFTQTPSGNNTITAGTDHYVKIATDGASTTVAPIYITLRCRRVP
jgi:hypothetical protein